MKFARKHPCQSVFFNKVIDLRPATLVKERLRHRYFPENFQNNVGGRCFKVATAASK